MAADLDVEYDEVLGNAPHPACMLSFARGQGFVTATERAFAWATPADGNDDRAVIEIGWIESLFRTAEVENPEGLRGVPMLSRCLHVHYLRNGLEALLDNGLIEADDDDDDAVRVFADYGELQDRADEVWATIEPDHKPDMDDDAWDYLEAVPANSPLKWLDEVSLEALTKRSKNLRAYTDLNKLLGPRALQASRADPASQINVMAGNPGGGQLLTVMRGYYLDPTQAGAVIPPAFMAHRLGDFFEDSRWPHPYEMEHPSFLDYAFDLAPRARWQKASEDEWPALIQTKISRAVTRLYPLSHLLADEQDQPAQLILQVQRLGDALLSGARAQKKVFRRITEVNAELDSSFRGLIEEGRAAGSNTTALMERILYLTASTTSKGKGQEHSGDQVSGGSGEEVSGPKRDQMRRALAEQSFARLEQKFDGKLKNPESELDKLDMLSECFSETTVLPKAVLLNCPGTKMSSYTQFSGFLDRLKDHRTKLPLYFGQCMAMDEETQEVPADLGTYEWDSNELELFRSFKWDKLDPLNKAVLSLRAEELGTSYTVHDKAKVYHDGHLIQLVKDTYGKLFKAIGYPATVSAKAGLSFTGFMTKIRRLHEVTLGMAPKEATKMFEIIDSYVDEGYRTAAAQAKNVIYGADPADRRLGAWISKDEPLLTKIEETLKNLQMVRSFRKAIPGVFESTPTARTLPGFESRKRDRDEEDQGGPSKKMPPGTGGGPPTDNKKGGPKPGDKTNKDVGKGPGKPPDQEVDLNSRQIRANRDLRFKHNPKQIFYYDDGSYSLKKQWFDWPNICKKYGWDHHKLCGPVIMALTREYNRELNCMDPSHR